MTWFVVFAGSVFGLYFWREYRVQQRDLQSASAPHRMGERYIGQVVKVPDGIADGSGRIKLGPRQWVLRGPNVPAGASVRVTGVDGAVLIVDRLSGK
jgi:membrane protein implicated in regulation of membrane protease activity